MPVTDQERIAIAQQFPDIPAENRDEMALRIREREPLSTHDTDQQARAGQIQRIYQLAVERIR